MCEDHLDQVWHVISAKLFVHAEHLRDMLPSMRVQLLLHGNLLQSVEQSKVQKKYNRMGRKKILRNFHQQHVSTDARQNANFKPYLKTQFKFSENK